jgi:hypothetical protein
MLQRYSSGAVHLQMASWPSLPHLQLKQFVALSKDHGQLPDDAACALYTVSLRDSKDHCFAVQPLYNLGLGQHLVAGFLRLNKNLTEQHISQSPYRRDF